MLPGYKIIGLTALFSALMSACVTPNTYQNDASIYGAVAGGQYRSILQKKCYPCHSSGQTFPDLSVDDATLVLNGIVFAKDPNHSPLILRVLGLSGTLMPKPPYTPLSDQEIAILKAWIAGL